VGTVPGRGMTATDEDLFRRLAEGDEEAFTLLYRRWQGPIFRFGLRMSGSLTLAEDVTQEVFMALVSGGGRYDPDRGSLASYLFGVAKNQVRRRFEKERPYVAIPQGEDEPAVGAEHLLEELDRTERVRRVREAVLALPAHYREVVVLFDLQLLSYQETADALGCAVGTVRSRLHRARALLLARLGGDAPLPHGAEARAGGMP
jgi:RNA polymerase sigma-70 factor (ECF subfamily)